jgi:hypothetical protein
MHSLRKDPDPYLVGIKMESRIRIGTQHWKEDEKKTALMALTSHKLSPPSSFPFS